MWWCLNSAKSELFIISVSVYYTLRAYIIDVVRTRARTRRNRSHWPILVTEKQSYEALRQFIFNLFFLRVEKTITSWTKRRLAWKLYVACSGPLAFKGGNDLWNPSLWRKTKNIILYKYVYRHEFINSTIFKIKISWLTNLKIITPRKLKKKMNS